MFELFGKSNYKIPKSEPLWKSGPEPTPETPDEHFRVGVTDDGRTTLTLTDRGGISITITMNQLACEQMIRMIRATYHDEVKIEDENV